jgi:hypothetical protein
MASKEPRPEAVEYARRLLDERLRAPSEDGVDVVQEALPQRPPEELDALAQAQGAPLAVNFDDLIGDFWPEDETCDDFIATIRQWRREGSGPRRHSK